MNQTKRAKQILVIRKDLKMRRGKECSQISHSSMAIFLNLKENHITNIDGSGEITIPLTPAMNAWISGHFTKITCYVNSEEELLGVFNRAKAAGLPCCLIQDAGFTEFHGVPTYTSVGIGPSFEDDIDPITKDLPLY